MSYSYSAEGGTRTRIRPFEYEYEYHFIEYEYEKTSNSATSKLTRRVVIDGESATSKLALSALPIRTALKFSSLSVSRLLP